MKTGYNTLNAVTTYNYDATSIASLTAVQKLKHYYKFNFKSGEIEFAPLKPEHFDNKLYKNVREGSIRWWLFEIRKSDYEFIQRKKFTRTAVKEYETNWKNKINNWYFTYDTGVNRDNTTTEGEAKRLSRYKLTTKTNNIDIITAAEAKMIGFKDNKPEFYSIIRDEDGNVVSVDVNIKNEDLYNVENLTKFSSRWWTLERMRYDWGDKYHPVAEGMIINDWKGIIFKCSNCIFEGDIIDYHERGWRQWVDAFYSYEKSEKSDINHNWNIISRLNNDELNEIAHNCPEYIISHMPPKLYANAIMYILSLLQSSNRINKSGLKSISLIYKSILPAIKTYNTAPTGCKNIKMIHINTAIDAIDYVNGIDIIKSIALKINQYKMLSTKLVGEFTSILDSINLNTIDNKSNYDMFDAYLSDNKMTTIDWYTTFNSLNDMFDKLDANYNETKLKFDLK